MAESITSTLTSKYATNNGVTIHYKAGGDGPLVVFIHGFPDFWYSWRSQIDGVATSHSIAAMDTRGYNLSDAPHGVEQYAMEHLLGDVRAVIAAEGRTSAVIVGHDWGGAIAWQFAAQHPEHTDRLVVVNLPHPQALAAAIEGPDSAQRNAFSYMLEFAKPGSEENLTAESLASIVGRTENEHERYVEAFGRSNMSSMMNYYRQGPIETRHKPGTVSVPVLQFHGLDDPVLLAGSIHSTWDYLEHTWTLVTIPGAGHWPHHDQPKFVTDTLVNWLNQEQPEIRDS